MDETISLPSVSAVIDLPENTVELTVDAKVLLNGELTVVSRTLTPTEVRRAFQNAEDYYCDPDAVYTLTEEGRKYVEKNLLC